MNSVLIVFLSLSLSGSILALILLALRPLIKNRLSQTWQYYIWLLVILRFLLPFTPQVSVVGEAVRFMQSVGNTPVIVDTQSVFDGNEQAAIPQIPLTPIMQTPQNIENEVITPNDTLQQSETPIKSVYWRDIMNNIWLLWIAVAMVLFVHKVASYRSFVRFVKVGVEKITDAHIMDIYCDELAVAKVKRRLPIYINNQVISPMLVGIIRPALIIPILEASDHELRNILRHELTHYKRLDFLYKWIVQITLCLHWFNPIVFLITKQIDKSCELSCDEAVIKHLDEDGRITYGDALIASLKAQGNYSNFVISMTMSENVNIVKERLDMIMSYKKKSKLIVGVTIILTMSLLCGFTFTGAYASDSNKNSLVNVPISTPNAGKEIYATTNSNKNVQSNAPTTTPNIEKEVVSITDNYKQIVKTLDGTNIQNINIYAELCTLKLEPYSGNTFEAVFSYPKITARNYEKYFDLMMEKTDGNTINISTDYEFYHGFDLIDGFDDSKYPTSTFLVIKVPQQHYDKISLELSVIGNKNLEFSLDTSALEIKTNVADMVFKSNNVFDKLYIDHFTGNLDLQLKELSKNMNVDVATGTFTLCLPYDPDNISLTINNKEKTDYGDDMIYYELPITWKPTIAGNMAVYERGNKQNIINVNNKRYGAAVFKVNIEGLSNNDLIADPSNGMTDTAPQTDKRNVADVFDNHTTFNQTSLVKEFNNQIVSSEDNFLFNRRIDVVDNNGFAYQGLVFLCKGSDSYQQVFNRSLEKVISAYPNSDGKINGYLDPIRDNRLRNYGNQTFSAIEKVVLIDANDIRYDAYVIAICGSEDFQKPYDNFLESFAQLRQSKR